MSQDVYTLDQFNHLPDAATRAALAGCCKSTRWVEQVLGRRPFAQFDDLLIAADEAFALLEPADWRDALGIESLADEDVPMAATEQMKATNASLRTMISDAI